MKKLVIISTIAMAVASWGASAQQSTPQPGEAENQPQSQEHFKDQKQKIAQRIQERIGKMQERLSCVQSAQGPNALRACFPEREGRGQGRPGAGQAGRQDGHGGGPNEGGDDHDD